MPVVDRPYEGPLRRFGIEIEFSFGGDNDTYRQRENLDRVLAELRAEGLTTATRLHGYLGHGAAEWVLKTDGSVGGGGELVGPPLNFDSAENRNQVERAIACLQRAGAKTDKRAGVHVHIDASDLTHTQIACVARTTTRYEDQIYRIASSGWRTMRPGAATFAKPLEERTVQRLAKCRTREELMRAWYGGRNLANIEYATRDHSNQSRYYALNLHGWFYRGAVEFRFFNSTLNAKRIMGYIVLCNGIVQDARDGNMRWTKKTAMRLGDMKTGRISEKQAWHRLGQLLRWEAKTPCTKEDLALVQYCWKDSTPQGEPREWLMAGRA